MTVERVFLFPGSCLGVLPTPQQPWSQYRSIESVAQIFLGTPSDGLNCSQDCQVRNAGGRFIRITIFVQKAYRAISSTTRKVTRLQSFTIWLFVHIWRPGLEKKNLGNERTEFCCVWGGSASSWITLRQEFRHSIQLEDQETRRCQKIEYRSETRLEEKGIENRVICLEQNNGWIVSLSVLEKASWSAPHNLQAQFEAIFTINDAWLTYRRQWYSINEPTLGHCDEQQMECRNNEISIGPSNNQQP
jgi:hypothetical protein